MCTTSCSNTSVMNSPRRMRRRVSIESKMPSKSLFAVQCRAVRTALTVQIAALLASRLWMVTMIFEKAKRVNRGLSITELAVALPDRFGYHGRSRKVTQEERQKHARGRTTSRYATQSICGSGPPVNRHLLLASSLALALSGCGCGSVWHGSFEGSVTARWLTHDGKPDRDMVLTEDFAYIAPDSVRWEASRDTVIDGASIPRVFWTAVGSPYVGDYRYASVVHDQACKTRTRTWQDTHLMFYNACRAGGVEAIQASVMYAAVYVAGPRWDPITRIDLEFEIDRRLPPGESFQEIQQWIDETNPTLGEIRARIDSRARPEWARPEEQLPYMRLR